MLADVNGNVSQHELVLKYPFEWKQTNLPFFHSQNYFLPDSIYTFQSKDMKIMIDAQTFYEPVKKSMNLNVGQLGTSKTVIQKPICVEMKVKNTSEIEKQYLSVNGAALETARENGWLASESKQLGTFSIKVDTIAPTIQFMPISSNNVLPSQFSWKIADNQSGIASYELFINGAWTIVYFDQKYDVVIWKNDRRASIIGPRLENVLSMEFRVTDRCGNVQTWSKELNVIDEPR
jgi:hypothetical protein